MSSISRQLVRWFVKPVVFMLSLVPLGQLLFRAFNDQLGANPIETLTHQTGAWGLYFLLITLSVTPVRKITGISWIVSLRRMLGLFAFFYACLHLLVYVWLDQYFSLSSIAEDIVKRPYITVGFSAWVLLLPLALTSTKAAVRRLGKNWKRLHKLVYVIVPLVILHFIWLVKADYAEPLFYLFVFILLMLARTSFVTLGKRQPG